MSLSVYDVQVQGSRKVPVPIHDELFKEQISRICPLMTPFSVTLPLSHKAAGRFYRKLVFADNDGSLMHLLWKPLNVELAKLKRKPKKFKMSSENVLVR